MTVTAKVLMPAKHLEDSQTAQYTADGLTAKISKFTVTNTSTSDATFSCNIVPAGGGVNASNLIIDNRTISPDETYGCPELVGHIIESGGFISTIAGTAGALTARISGIEIT